MKLLIAANWKMYKTVKETEAFLETFKGFQDRFSKTDVVICPPYTALFRASQILSRTSIFLGSQNIYPEKEGAFTGEVSPLMLKELKVSHVIIGHSERRRLFYEDNHIVNRKLHSALEHNFIPIFCVGETGEEREAGKTEEILSEQLRAGLQGISPRMVKSLVIAYEPVWAIGTGQAASHVDAVESSKYIWNTLEGISKEISSRSRVLYGGSVNKENIGGFTATREIQGVLVGGASLQADSFRSLIEAAREALAD